MIQKTKYYYQIEAFDNYSRSIKTIILSFTSGEDNDITPPILQEIHTTFVSGNTAVFVWTTDKKANSWHAPISSDSFVYINRPVAVMVL